jgi:murein DD-endopeptidase MepM/ murein hydrolase activator NlpD
VQGALQASGVPAPVAAKIANSKVGAKLIGGNVRRAIKGAKLTGAALGMVLVMLLAGGSTGFGPGRTSPTVPVYLWTIEADEALAHDVPDWAVFAYRSAGARHNVPWTVLAAFGASASSHARTDPYLQPVDPFGTFQDGAGRLDEPGSEQCWPPSWSISGPDSSSGHGPLLLAPALLEVHAIRASSEQLQDLCFAADVLARRMAQISLVVERERRNDGSGTWVENLYRRVRSDDDLPSAQAIAQHWGEVIDRLDVVVPVPRPECRFDLDAEVASGAEPARAVATAIAEIWWCELAGTTVFVDTRRLVVGGTEIFETAQPAASARFAITEAQEAAWNFSAWDTSVCNPGDTYAGIFPLTAAQFLDHRPDHLRFVEPAQPLLGADGTPLRDAAGQPRRTERDRCDAEANIAAAARAYRAAASVAPAERPRDGGPWQPVVDGWSGLAVVLGPEPDRFYTAGPTPLLRVDAECTAGLVGVVFDRARAGTLPAQSLSIEDRQAWVAANIDAIFAAAPCPGADTSTRSERLRVLGTLVQPEFAGDDEGPDEVAAGDEAGGTAPAGLSVNQFNTAQAVFAAAAAASLEAATPTVGETALVARLSPDRLESQLPYRVNAQPAFSSARILTVTGTYGGLYRGDPVEYSSFAALAALADTVFVAEGAFSGVYACPLDAPRFINDWGFPRGGGTRQHQGNDLFAPHGAPAYAFTDGTVTRHWYNAVGGTSLYLLGDDGNQYYYTHLSGYVGSVPPGTRVFAGQHIAFNGNSGNARTTPPHIHFEIRVGGPSGTKTNPFPWVSRACGR